VERETATSAFLYNFAKNIRWPQEDRLNSFQWVIYGRDEALATALNQLSTTKKVRGKRIVSLQSTSLDDLKKAHLIYVPNQYINDVKKIHEVINGHACLLVTDRYSDQRLIMINLFDTDAGTLTIEINKANIINHGLVVMDNIILLGGTEVDVAGLYLEGQENLIRMQTYSAQLETNISRMQDQMKAAEQSLVQKNAEINTNKDSLLRQTKVLNRQHTVLDSQSIGLQQQDYSLQLFQLRINNQQQVYAKQAQALTRQQKALDQGKQLMETQQHNIRQQKETLLSLSDRLKLQGQTIQKQRLMVFYLAAAILLALLLIASVFLGYINKKKLSWELEKRVQERTHELHEMLSELILAKQKAEESEQLKTAFLHNVSHEICTPMNAIIGFSGLIRDEKLPENKRQEFADIIIHSTQQLLNVITDIINMASLETGQELIHESTFNLNALFSLLYNQYASKCHKKHVQLNYKTHLSDQEAMCVTDEAKLTAILSNLINNAIKFTEYGSIEFGYSLTNNRLTCYVKDTGRGIPKAMHAVIFERFRQVEAKDLVLTGGSGLGLSLTKEYIELLGGHIELESEVNLGSTFRFSLPYKPPESPSNADSPHAVVTPSNLQPQEKTILIAEDDELNFLLLNEMLKDMSYHISWAKNGKEAVDYCRSNKPAMVLMDLKMPEMDGYEATRQIKDIQPTLPILAQSAFTTEDDRKKALDSGCNGFISKPINKRLLLDIMNDML